MSGPADREATIRDRRVQYETAGLDVADVDPDPMMQWRRWFEERKVVTGVSDGKSIAIRDGLAVGEFVAVPKPAKKPAVQAGFQAIDPVGSRHTPVAAPPMDWFTGPTPWRT